ncbi:VanZ family protein [Salipaludibacillus aurantiacus]|uniref:VanZ like family protein n=1 Tax=Salipaludibacillus aurantiacus TaxID=1601833 RepID=A0A1H9U8D3_9BACI|nr:VanZ family protein [Salipaludibacillus aurantiacus]SES05609.1 VanZ like family protein [Salipaludibacillus aurantiacus]
MRMAAVIVVSILLVISMSTLAEMAASTDGLSVQAVYKKEASLSFLTDLESSFYSAYSLHNNLDLQIRKAGHFVIYGVIALLIFFTTPVKKLWERGLSGAASSTLIGLIDEIHQYFLISRSGRILDVYINAAGSLTFATAACVGYLIFRKLEIKKTAEAGAHREKALPKSM